MVAPMDGALRGGLRPASAKGLALLPLPASQGFRDGRRGGSLWSPSHRLPPGPVCLLGARPPWVGGPGHFWVSLPTAGLRWLHPVACGGGRGDLWVGQGFPCARCPLSLRGGPWAPPQEPGGTTRVGATEGPRVQALDKPSGRRGSGSVLHCGLGSVRHPRALTCVPRGCFMGL